MGCLSYVIAITVGLIVEAAIGGTSFGIVGFIAGCLVFRQLRRVADRRGKSASEAGEGDSPHAETLQLLRTASRLEMRPDDVRCHKCQSFTQLQVAITTQDGQRHSDKNCMVCDASEMDAKFDAELLRLVMSASQIDHWPITGRCLLCQGLTRQQIDVELPNDRRWTIMQCAVCDSARDSTLEHQFLVSLVRVDASHYGRCPWCREPTLWRSVASLTGDRRFVYGACTACNPEFAEWAELASGEAKGTRFAVVAAGICLQCGENALWNVEATTPNGAEHELTCSNCHPLAFDLKEPLVREELLVDPPAIDAEEDPPQNFEEASDLPEASEERRTCPACYSDNMPSARYCTRCGLFLG